MNTIPLEATLLLVFQFPTTSEVAMVMQVNVQSWNSVWKYRLKVS